MGGVISGLNRLRFGSSRVRLLLSGDAKATHNVVLPMGGRHHRAIQLGSWPVRESACLSGAKREDAKATQR